MAFAKRATVFLGVVLLIVVCFQTGSVRLSAQSSDETVDFVLVLDCTDSMAKSDTSNICEAAAKMFTDLAPSNNARVAVVAFGNTWSPAYVFDSELSYMNDVMGSYARTRVCVTYDMVGLDDSNERGSIKNAIHDRMNETKYTHTNTYIGGGLMTALDILCAKGSDDAAVILMSDGRLSGFDSTDGVEWKRTNRELVYDAIDIAAKKGWKVYSVELNDDGKNKPTSAAKQLFNDLSSKTGADSREITESNMDQLVNGFIDIFGSFMNADAEVIEQRITNGNCSFELNIPEVTSESNIVITGGNILSITVDGTEYSSNTYNDKAYFVKNQDGHYTLLKLFAPGSGRKKVTIKGDEGANIQVQTVSTRDLPVGLTFSENSPIIRNTELEINAFLANPESGEPVSADKFYKSNQAKLTVTNKTTGKSETLDTEVSDKGYSAVYNFRDPGEYEVSVRINSNILRGGSKAYSRNISVENYGMEAVIDDHSSEDMLAKWEVITVRAFLTGPDGRLTGDLYKDGDAELEVRRGNSTVASGIALNADKDGNGYFCDYTLPETGNYTFTVTTKAACLWGNPSRLSCDSEEIACGGYTTNINWSYSYSGKSSILNDGASLSKSDVINIEARLLNDDGKQIKRSVYLADGEAELIIERDGNIVDEIGLSIDGSGSAYSGSWRVRKSGDLTAIVKLNDKNGSGDSIRFKVTNHSPVLLKDKFEAKCHVGETIELPISDYVKDDDGDILEISAVGADNAGDFGWKVSDDESKIIISAGKHANNVKLTFKADDGDDSVEFPAQITIQNRKPQKTDDLELPHFVLGAPAFMFFVEYDHEPVSFVLDDYFNDPDGLPLDYSLESKSGLAKLSGHKLEIDPSTTASEKLVLRVTDSSDETLTVDLNLSVEDWWALNIKRFLITVAIVAAIIILCIIIFRRESNIGYLKITSATSGGEMLELNEILNKKRISSYSIRLSKFIRNRVVASDRVQVIYTDKGKIIGHMIFGNSVTIKGSNADDIFVGGVPARDTKKVKIKAGNSVTLRYGDVQITIFNNN